MLKFSLITALCVGVSGLQPESPEGPSQQCQDDAGPPWGDDIENFPGGRYHDGTPAAPGASDSTCPTPLAAACAANGAKAAHLDGPVDCGGAGWFCRISDREGWMNPDYNDKNFAHCNASDADERDDDGHCHGSDADETYGWWVRDHWWRGYAGDLTCCCDWSALEGLANRCDYRMPVTDDGTGGPFDLETCRDANEDHGKGYEDGCAAHASVDFFDPAEAAGNQCWTVSQFANPESIGEDDEEEEEEEENDESECADDSDWRLVNKKGRTIDNKGCNWVANKPNRCNKMGTDGVRATEACSSSCETCSEDGDEEEEEEEEEEEDGDEGEEEDEEEEDGECTDDTDWRVKNKSCNWIADAPEARCAKKGSGGIFAWAACCETCAEWRSDVCEI